MNNHLSFTSNYQFLPHYKQTVWNRCDHGSWSLLTNVTDCFLKAALNREYKLQQTHRSARVGIRKSRSLFLLEVFLLLTGIITLAERVEGTKGDNSMCLICFENGGTRWSTSAYHRNGPMIFLIVLMSYKWETGLFPPRFVVIARCVLSPPFSLLAQGAVVNFNTEELQSADSVDQSASSWIKVFANTNNISTAETRNTFDHRDCRTPASKAITAARLRKESSR